MGEVRTEWGFDRRYVRVEHTDDRGDPFYTRFERSAAGDRLDPRGRGRRDQATRPRRRLAFRSPLALVEMMDPPDSGEPGSSG